MTSRRYLYVEFGVNLMHRAKQRRKQSLIDRLEWRLNLDSTCSADSVVVQRLRERLTEALRRMPGTIGDDGYEV